MRRISSRATFYQKRIIPLISAGILIAFIALPLGIWLHAGQYPPLPFLVMPVAIGIISFFVWKKTVFDLVDEVWDVDDALIIKNKGQEERVALSDIVNVSYSPIGGGQRVSLLLRRPSVFGDRIHFCPPFRLLPFLGSP